MEEYINYQMSMYNNNGMSGGGGGGGGGNPNQMPPSMGQMGGNSFSQQGGGGGSNGGNSSNAGPPQLMPPSMGAASFQGTRRGSAGGATDRRRGSMASLPFDPSTGMPDILGRRGSLDFNDAFFRRDSLDSSTAVIDACILDLTRRRISMAMGVPSQQTSGGGTVDLSGLPPGSGGGPSPSQGGPGGLGGLGAVVGGNPNSASTHQGVVVGGNGGGGGGGVTMPQNPVSSLAARQQQIQHQQMELDKRQKEIDMQRQQLLSGLQDPSMQQSTMGGGLPPPTQGGGGGGMGGLGGIGLGGPGGNGGQGGYNLNNSQNNNNLSQNNNSPSLPSPRGMPPTMPGGPGGLGGGPGARGGQGGAGGGDANQQWWICQVCNAKAFASRGEAMQHEAICTEGRQHQQQRQQGQQQMQGQQQQQQQQHQHMQGQQQQMQQQMQGQQQQQQQVKNHMDRQMPPNMGHHSFAGMAPMGHQDPQPDGMDDQGGEGPFAVLPQPLPLAMLSDKDWLTPLHCFVRRHCVQVFCASSHDVATPSKGKRKPIQVGQVGIRCPHCHTNTSPAGQRERGSVYYPTTISSIYNATMNLLQRHLHSCSAVPDDIMQRYQTLKADDARSGTSKKYWVESALSLGLVDTASGIRFSARRPPPLPRLSRQQHSTGMSSADRRNSNDFFSTSSNAGDRKALELTMDSRFDDLGGGKAGDMGVHNDDKQEYPPAAPLVTPEDKPYATAFSYHLLSQMQPCVFTEADRLGKRKGLPAGFAGLACRHCFGGYGSGRFFPSSIKTLSDTSKTLNVLFNHMMRCRKCPQDVKDTLEKLRAHHDDERAKMKFGSQKAFFAKIWARLHEKDGHSSMSSMSHRHSDMKRKLPPAFIPPPADKMQQLHHQQQQQQQQQQHNMMMGGPVGPPMGHHPMAGMLGGLDVLSRQAEADIKRQRIGL